MVVYSLHCVYWIVFIGYNTNIVIAAFTNVNFRNVKVKFNLFINLILLSMQLDKLERIESYIHTYACL